MDIGNIKIQPGKQLFVIAGPCVIESADQVRRICSEVLEQLDGLDVAYIFKASYDKANRTSGESYRGPGLAEGLQILADIKQEFSVPIITDVHSPAEASAAAGVVDIIQIPAFLCRQTDLLYAAAQTGIPVSIKKGQFLSPHDMQHVIKKLESKGNTQLLLTERGASFGYNTLVSDMRSIPIMQDFGYPVIYDATHSVQAPGGKGSSSGGNREFVPQLSRAAIAVGADGLFLETHYDPESALSDGPNMIPTTELRQLLSQCIEIFKVVHA